MLKFENNHIITGYIKQLLNSFNLPKCRVYTSNKPVLASTHFKLLTEENTSIGISIDQLSALNIPYRNTPASFIYIKDGKFAKYVGDAWEPVDFTGSDSADIYMYGSYIPNVTKNLRVKNNRYDSYTHEYLGDYLRFYRDYHGVDLMPLYNCFSNRVCSNLNLKFDFSGTTINFSDLDSNHKIYMLPVKLFQNYTIALSCPTQVEICCGFFGKQQSIFDAENKLPKLTYTKYSHLKFEQPILFQKLSVDSLLSPTASNIITTDAAVSTWTKNGVTLTMQDILYWAKNEVDLKMFIKLPVNTKTSIAVLEGNYVGWNDTQVRLYYNQTQTQSDGTQVTKQIDCFEKAYSTSVVNFAPIDPRPQFLGPYYDDEQKKLIIPDKLSPGIPLDIKNISSIPLRSPLQLLKVDTKVSYPFADRLVEYLFDNVVTPVDPFEDNIKRVQTFCSNMYDYDKSKRLYWPTFAGVWDNELKYLCYRWLTCSQGGNKFKRAEDSYYIHDLLGYVDKDAENNLTVGTGNNTITLESINLYPDCYNSSYTKK